MPKLAKLMNDPTLLEAALEGLFLQKQRIEAQIAEVKSLLGQQKSTAGSMQPSHGPKRQLSEAARRRIAAAQKKRWAEYRKAAAHQSKNSKTE